MGLILNEKMFTDWLMSYKDAVPLLSSCFLVKLVTVFIIWILEWYFKNMVQIQKKIAYNLKKKLSNSQKVVSLQLSVICTAASRIPLFIFFSPQTILIQNIYRNPQNSAQTADGSHCKSHSWRNFFFKNGVKEPIPKYEKIMLASELLT